MKIVASIMGFIVLLIALALLWPQPDYPQEIPKNFRDSPQQIRCDIINKWVKTGAFGWVKGSIKDLLSIEEKIVLAYCYKEHRGAIL